MHGNAVMIRGISIPTPEKPNISIISGSSFTKLAEKNEHFALMIYVIDQALHAHKVTDRARRAAIYVVVPELRTDLSTAIATAAADATTTTVAIEDDKIRGWVPAEYHEFLPLFKKAIADVLPPYRPYDHKITLKEGFSAPFGLLYSLSRPEL